MREIIANIIVLMMITLSIIFIVIEIKKSKGVIRILYWSALVIIFVPILIYVVDKFNIPTKYHYLDNVNANNWFSFIGMYASAILGSFMSGIILVLITFKQIKEQAEDNKEAKRIENMPIIDCKITDEIYKYKSNYQHSVILKETGKAYNLFMKLQNIGLNHAKDLEFLVKVDGEEDKRFSFGGRKSFLKKEESVCIRFIFNLDCKASVKRTINFCIYYTDLLGNLYEKEIEVLIQFVENEGSRIPSMQLIKSEVIKEEFTPNY